MLHQTEPPVEVNRGRRISSRTLRRILSPADHPVLGLATNTPCVPTPTSHWDCSEETHNRLTAVSGFIVLFPNSPQPLHRLRYIIEILARHASCILHPFLTFNASYVFHASEEAYYNSTASGVPLKKFGIVNRAAVLYRYFNSPLYCWYTARSDTTSSGMATKTG